MFFSGGARLDGRTVSHHTVVLLISQSGQTFPTLHATRLMVSSAQLTTLMLLLPVISNIGVLKAVEHQC